MQTRAYRSKIGRLPFAIRNELNERILDGARAVDVLTWLNATPEYKRVMRSEKCAALNAQNLTDWRGTGYKDWLNARSDAERVRMAAELSQTLVSASGGDVATVAARIAAARIIELVEHPDDPKVLNDAARTLAALRVAEQGAEKNKLAQRKLDLTRETLDFDKEKFKRQTCELFLKWAKSHVVADIANSKKSHDDKIKALLKYMDTEEASQ